MQAKNKNFLPILIVLDAEEGVDWVCHWVILCPQVKGKCENIFLFLLFLSGKKKQRQNFQFKSTTMKERTRFVSLIWFYQTPFSPQIYFQHSLSKFTTCFHTRVLPVFVDYYSLTEFIQSLATWVYWLASHVNKT